MSNKDELLELADRLREMRDRLRVKVNLAGKEVRDDWEELEEKWGDLRTRLKVIRETAGEVGKDARGHAADLAEDVREGYERLKQRLGLIP